MNEVGLWFFWTWQSSMSIHAVDGCRRGNGDICHWSVHTTKARVADGWRLALPRKRLCRRIFIWKHIVNAIPDRPPKLVEGNSGSHSALLPQPLNRNTKPVGNLAFGPIRQFGWGGGGLAAAPCMYFLRRHLNLLFLSTDVLRPVALCVRWHGTLSRNKNSFSLAYFPNEFAKSAVKKHSLVLSSQSLYLVQNTMIESINGSQNERSSATQHESVEP